VPEIVAQAAAGRRVALVFGPEDHGLSNADLELCQRRLCIPTAGEYASLNLAQAVLVCAYELLLGAMQHAVAARARGAGVRSRPRAASLDRRGRRAFARSDEMDPATGAEREALLTHLDAALRRIGFLAGPGQRHILRDVRSLFDRSGLTRRDVRIWRGIARQTLWAAAGRQDPPTAAPKAEADAGRDSPRRRSGARPRASARR
jgi:tRNA/rRNA methyltransferase